MIEEEEVEAGDDGDFSLFGESFVDDEETPWLILRAFFPFFDDEEDVVEHQRRELRSRHRRD